MVVNNREKELIKKLLKGTANRTELVEIDSLLNTPRGRVLFDEAMDELGENEETETDEFYLNEKLQAFKQKKAIPPTILAIPKHERKIRKLSYIHYAAAAVLLISAVGLYVMLLQRQNGSSQIADKTTDIEYLQYANDKGKRSSIALSDGTVISLGAASRLKYPKQFTKTKRDVYLEGEAFFEVEKDAKRPFTVYTGDVATRVLGTSFKITSFPGAPLQVEVATGKVQVTHQAYGKTDTLGTMIPGDMLSWQNNQLTKCTIQPKDVLAWKNNVLVFHQQPMSDIMDELQRWYNVEVVYPDPGLRKEKITITLDGNVPLSKTMNVLAATSGFKYRIENKKVIVNR